MRFFPNKADFYTKSVTYNDYGEAVASGTFAFSTGARLKTVSFGDQVKATGTVDAGKYYLFVRKNPNTSAVSEGDFVIVDNQTLEVTGVDQKFSDRTELMLLVEYLENPVV